jgi:tryptophanyl-tRNA synthetase
MNKKRALSGIQATGNITIGNYLGALRQWVKAQDEYAENFYFIPDLHTLTARPNPADLTEAIYATTAWLLAVGIDPKRSVVYAQSQIPAHAELCWILNSYVTMGELSRMTQYKEKSSKRGQLVGLFTYPVLQAADILLYDAHVVPVGEDQVQHIELARDIAERFNNQHGDTFVLPEANVSKASARVMDLQDPLKKMSKSDEQSHLGAIRMLDSPEQVRDKVSRAVTDSDSQIKLSTDKPGVSNLLNILASLTDQTAEAVAKTYQGKSYKDLKTDLAEQLVQILQPMQASYQKLIADKPRLKKVLADGREQANKIAEAKLAEVKQKIGLQI